MVRQLNLNIISYGIPSGPGEDFRLGWLSFQTSMQQKMKTTVSEKVSFENKTFWREHTETLIKQGHFLCLNCNVEDKKLQTIFNGCKVALHQKRYIMFNQRENAGRLSNN